jgi:glycosyltransferase involved in cell wall biosynthesis
MKILQVVTQMEGGGAQRAAYLLHVALQKRGHKSELWFLYLKRPTYAAKHGVRTLWPRRPGAFGYLRLAARLFAWIRAYKPDVTITHTHYANVLGQLVSALARTKRRVAVHHSPIGRYPVLARCGDWLFGTVGIYTTQVAVSDAVVESMSAYPGRYKKIVHRIHNGVVVDQKSPSPHFRPPSCLAAPGLRILHVGRLAREKNHVALLKAIQQLPAVRLVLVGNGELRETIERQVKAFGLTNRVQFLGEITPEEVRAIMHECDLFMFPSVYEAMPMALLEAMAAGMPIIASDIPANREALQDAGILIPPQPSELAQAARTLLADRPCAYELGKKAAERARQFTVDAMTDGYERLLQS